MARIRSTHPEQWTDDQFVTCSPLARLLALGIRNFADDNGAFEWNPIKLKMWILPADNCDIEALLEELTATDQVRKYEVDGKCYGAIRSFRKYQKPKKPSCKYPKPQIGKEFLDDTELVRHLFGSGTELAGDWWGKFTSDGEGEGEGKGKGVDPRAKRATQPPKSLPITDKMREWAASNAPRINVQTETERFLDYHRSKGSRHRDWVSAWRNWMRKAAEFKRDSAAVPERPYGAEAL